MFTKGFFKKNFSHRNVGGQNKWIMDMFDNVEHQLGCNKQT